MRCPSRPNRRKLLLSIASSAANDLKLAPLSGEGEASNAERDEQKMISSLCSTIAFDEELFGAGVDFIVSCLSRNS